MLSRYHKTLLAVFLILTCAASSVKAEQTDEYQEGFLTSYLNRAIEKAMSGDEAGEEPLQYGRHITKYVSAPQFGGYFVGKYSYSSRDNADENGFECRMVRFYVSGTILRDFKYRVQLELKNPAMRDYTLEWVRFKEFQIKVGQFKRSFTYDNPMHPWNLGMGNYSQLARHMTALSVDDPSGEVAQNGRDLGLQLQGDLFPVGKDQRRLIRYQAAMFNGNGQNKKDNNKQKDWMGNIQVQPVKDLYIGLFGWTGTYTGSNGVSVRRNRWALGSIYEHNDWSFRAEYAHHSGLNVKDFDVETQSWNPGSSNRADGWYLVLGVPITRWLKVYGTYDAYREDASWSSMKSIYGICPNFELHKNLKFQVQYNYINDRTSSDHNYHELWAQTYVRF
ncbi:MAG: porin [Bacteroidaceae bacterium]|nr:porin [Bacteroidaceae bacterium]